MSAFTPGPWTIHPRTSTHVVAGERGICSAGGHFSTEYDSTTENEANAHLIAAAPDLYEFARAVFADKSAYQWHVAAQAVLRKAEGAV